MAIRLILLPGLVCDETVWLHQMAGLRDVAECSVADYGAANSIEQMAEMVLAGAPERFAIAGHSMGGRVAFELLRRAPERISHAAMMDTRTHKKPAGEAGEMEAKGRFELLEIARTRGMRAMAEKWVQGMVHPSRLSDAALIDAILAMFGRKTPEIFAAQIEALLNRPDAGPVLPGIRAKTLILCGRQDAWSQVQWHEEMAQRIPAARLAIMEQCGHMATMERPDEVTAAMREWLS